VSVCYLQNHSENRLADDGNIEAPPPPSCSEASEMLVLMARLSPKSRQHGRCSTGDRIRDFFSDSRLGIDK